MLSQGRARRTVGSGKKENCVHTFHQSMHEMKEREREREREVTDVEEQDVSFITFTLLLTLSLSTLCFYLLHNF